MNRGGAELSSRDPLDALPILPAMSTRQPTVGSDHPRSILVPEVAVPDPRLLLGNSAEISPGG